MIEPATLASRAHGLAGKRLTRLIWLIVLLVAGFAVSTTVLPWTFSASALRNEVAAQIRQSTGLAALSQGRAVFALLPQPHVKIDQISFGDPDGTLKINAEYFKGNLRILPLLVGRLEIASATLLKPELVINLDGKPMPPDSAIGRAAEATPESSEAAAADAARLGVVSLVNGTARLVSKTPGSDFVIDDIDVTLDWRNLSSAATLTGKVRVRGEFGDVAAWVAEPADLLRGGRSQMTLDIKTDALAMTASGSLSAGQKPEFGGRLRAESQNLQKLLELIGYPIPRTSPLSSFKASGDAKLNGDGLFLSNLILRAAGSDFEGSLAVEKSDPKPVLSGTLATDLLSIDPFFSHFQRMIGEDGRWNHEALDFRALTTADLDIRISANRARLARLELRDAALSLITHGNRLDFTLAEARAYRGLVRARTSLLLHDDQVDFHGSGALTDVDVGALSFENAGLPEVTGTASGTVTLEATGRNMSDFIDRLDGRLQFNVQKGDVRGVDLARFLHPPGDSAPQRSAVLAARLPYDKAQLSIKILKGTAEVEQGLADGPGGHLLLTGTSTLSDRKLDMRAVILPLLPDPLSKSALDYNILIKGAWDHPLIAPATP